MIFCRFRYGIVISWFDEQALTPALSLGERGKFGDFLVLFVRKKNGLGLDGCPDGLQGFVRLFAIRAAGLGHVWPSAAATHRTTSPTIP